MERPEWREIKELLFSLGTVVCEYCKHLAKECEQQKQRHESSFPVISHKFDAHTIEIESTQRPVSTAYAQLNRIVNDAADYEMIEFDQFSPCDSQQRYRFIRDLRLSSPVMLS